MHRTLALSLLLAACASDDGGDDPGATDAPTAPPTDAPLTPPADAADDPASDAAANRAGDAGDGLADVGSLPDVAPPDVAPPDAAPMVAVGLAVGQRAPDFTLPDADGVDVSITDFRGGYALVVGTSVW